MQKYIVAIQTIAPLMPCAKESIIELNLKHDLYCITARGFLSSDEITITNHRFLLDDIKLKSIFFNMEDKAEFAKNLRLDLFIDDRPKNVLAIAEKGIKCLYFKDAKGININHPLVQEVHSWGEIMYYIDQIEKDKNKPNISKSNNKTENNIINTTTPNNTVWE